MGHMGYNKLCRKLKEGVFCTNFCISRESNRIVEMDRKLNDGAKKSRKRQGHAKRF